MPDDNDVKASELALWNTLLEDDNAARLRPEYQNGALRAHAAALHRLGVIDNGELLELNELADARYAHAAEELLAGLEDDM